MTWTNDSLKDVVREKIGAHKFIVVSNREPYIHIYGDGGIRCITPASGMTVALDPVMRACGGTWIARDRATRTGRSSTTSDRVRVPPEDPSYTLRRVWLTKRRRTLSTTAIPTKASGRSATSSTSARSSGRATGRSTAGQREVRRRRPRGDRRRQGFVFIQDYHFALLPRLIKERRPDIVVAQFWHIPWPNPEAFRVCPQAEEILWGLLGNDILGFHIRYHCLNFLDSVDRFLEVRVDRERLSVFKGGRETLVRPFPISIDFETIDGLRESPDVEDRARPLRKRISASGAAFWPIGIDRMDYTKGIVERFSAVDRFLEKYPEYVGKFVFLQLGPLSRIHIPKIQSLQRRDLPRDGRHQRKLEEKDWQPIILHKKHLGLEDLVSYYRAADLCIVSSIHDGMNLVAKEFVASRTDEKGVLILSQFTGSSRELEQAILVNPIATDRFADAIKQALEMAPRTSRRERMRRMRETVRENNVYRWAGKIVNEMRKRL